MNDKKMKLRKQLYLQKHPKNKNKFNNKYWKLKKKKKLQKLNDVKDLIKWENNLMFKDWKT